jgi:TonB family protein
MKRLREGRQEPNLLNDTALPDQGGLLKPGIFSLLLHIALVLILILSARSSTITKVGPSVYRVTLRPFSPPGNGIQQGSSARGLPGPPGGLSAPTIAEKPKPDENLKRTGVVETTKPHQRKAEKKGEKVERGEKLEKGKGTRKDLREALEDIRRKVALEDIQKRVARRESSERLTKERQSSISSSQEPIVSSSKGSAVIGSGTGMGSGTGTGPGSGGFSAGGLPGGSPGGSSVLEAKLNDYYSLIWAKIKKEWTLPENLPKGKIDFEAIIVVIIEKDGKVKKSWFEKKSGNALYDQMAMRAIKKAEPFPPIPKEFSDETFEIGIRFHPD